MGEVGKGPLFQAAEQLLKGKRGEAERERERRLGGGGLLEVTLNALQGTWHPLSDHRSCWCRAVGAGRVRGLRPSRRALNAKPKTAQGWAAAGPQGAPRRPAGQVSAEAGR